MENKMKKFYCASIIWMVLVTLVAYIGSISPWIATPIVVSGIILIPGILWSLNLNIRTERVAEYVLYSMAIGVCFLIVGGLVINLALPYIGVSQPLAQLPLIIFLDVSVLVLIGRAYISKIEFLFIRKFETANALSLFLGIVPIVFPILSAIGAQRLNNGTNGTVTLLMLFAIAAYAVMLISRRRSLQSWVYISALYFISLALLLMYSLRSGHIIGWDINQEYEVFQTTLQHLSWKMSYYPGLDYNACMSITILPTIFKELTHVSGEYVFKIIFQMLFAVSPVMVYVLARRYVNNALAFLAAFLFISQTWFFEQMPALIRQETAFIFYIAILLVLFDTQLRTRARYILFYLFAAGLVLSHYSTAYVWLGVLVGVLALSYGARLFIKSSDKQRPILNPLMVAIPFALVFIWQAVLTHSSGAVAHVVTPVINISSTATVPAVPITAISPQQSNLAADQNLRLGQEDAIYHYSNEAGYQTYADAAVSGYVPVLMDENAHIAPKLPRVLSVVVNFLGQASRVLLIGIFPLIGIVVIYIALRRQPNKGTEKYNFIILGIVSYGLIAVLVFIPYLQQYYNLTRLYLQMFVGISILAMTGATFIAKYLPRYHILAVAIMAAIMFCLSTGASDQLTGGQARITLNQPPSTLDSFYIYDAEIAGAQWLAAHRVVTTAIQSDDLAALRLHSFGNMESSNNAIFPQTFERGSYVYLDTLNLDKREVFMHYKSTLVVYSYPLDFLQSHKNLIYNNGGSEIYR
jgi:uncharacterized membrane protein